MAYISQLPEYNLTTAQLNLLFGLRMIWRDITTWLRAYLEYVFLDSEPELKELAAKKLTDVPIKYADIFRIYFGNEVADEHVILMTNYVNLLMDLIDAIKIGDTDAISEYTNQIDKNIEERVEFLTDINPFWDKTIMSNLLTNFNNRTINEINTFADKYYQRNLEIFSSLLTYTDKMGDYFADGMLKYFTFGSRGE